MTSTKEITIERVIPGPRDVVFNTWIQPEHRLKWWGPRGFTTTQSIKPTQDNVWQFTMHSPDGKNYPNRITYKKIIQNERIEYRHDNGTDNEQAFNTTVLFKDQGKKTLLNMTLSCHTDIQYEALINSKILDAGKQTLQRLEEEILAINGFKITRLFNTTPERLYTVWSDTNHMLQWFSPAGFNTHFLKENVKIGGVSHYCMSDFNNTSIYGTLTYQELLSPHRLVYIQSFSDEKGHIIRPEMNEFWPLKLLTTITFEPVGSQTNLTILWNPIEATQKEIDTFNEEKPGMTQGWTGTLDQLDRYITTLN